MRGDAVKNGRTLHRIVPYNTVPYRSKLLVFKGPLALPRFVFCES